MTDRSRAAATTVTAVVSGPQPNGVDARPLFPDRRIGRYELGEMLGAGGMGTVYRAHDPDLKRALAIKVVTPRGDDASHLRVLREAESMARLRHPNVVPIFDVGTAGHGVYLVMPLLEGGTLRTWLAAERRSWRAIATRFLAAARGLAAAHAIGFVHRDFKPDNVLLGDHDEVQVSDFGLVRLDATTERADPGPAPPPADPALTHAGALLGTPAYMAPEQLDHASVDARADQFSFSVALYEALFGCRPFALPGRTAADLAVMRDRIRAGQVRAPAPGHTAPRWLRTLVLRGLREEPTARWPSMQALIRALERGLRWRRPSTLWISAAVLAGIIALSFTTRELTSRGATSAAALVDARSWVERPLSTRGDIGDAKLSPDGAQIAAIARETLLLIPTAGGPPRTLQRGLPIGTTVAWSARGDRIVLHEGSRYRSFDLASGAIEVVPSLSGDRGQLLADGTTIGFPSARRIRVTRPGSLPILCWTPGDFVEMENAEILHDTLYLSLVHADLTLSLVAVRPPCGPARIVVDHLAATQITARDDGHVFAAVPRSGGVELQGYTAGGVATGERLRPEAERIVGARLAVGVVFSRTQRSVRLFDPEQPARTLHDGMQNTLVLAPDGRRFAAVDWAPDLGSVWITDAEGLGAPPPPIATGVGTIAWSPDGRRLAATSQSEPAHASIQLIDVLTGGVTRTEIADASPYQPLVWLDDDRVAFQRSDNQTYRWVSVRDHATGLIVDPALGWAFNLAVSRHDGTLALHWNRIDSGRGTWIIRPDGTQIKLRPNEAGGVHAWSVDGETLWLFDPASAALDRYDLATGQLTHVRTLHLAPNERMWALYPMADGRVLVRTLSGKTDLYLYGPGAT